MPEAPGALARAWGAAWRLLLFAVVYSGLAAAGSLLPRVPGPGGLSWTDTAVALASAVLAGWVMLNGVERRPPGALGFAAERAAPRGFAAGLVLGGAVLGAAVLAVAATGGLRWVQDGGTAAGYAAALAEVFLFLAVAAAFEEALFRGYPFQVLVNAMGDWPAALAVSGLFAWAHHLNPNVGALALANIFLAGVFLSLAYLRTRSLWFATGVHLGWNWTMAALLDLPVSGLPLDTPLYSAVETGADWWTGGAFGPEAGVAATAALLLGTGWLLRTRRVGASPGMRALRPLPDVPFWVRGE